MEIDDNALYKSIGERVKAHRTQIQVTQKQLADEIGVERTSITNIESGLQKLPIHQLYRICQALKVDPFDLLPSLEEVRQSEMEEVEIDGQSLQMTPKTAHAIRKLLEDFSDSEQI
ncbi:MAG: helix-turn-helix transcriptional regulator [Chloroflexota bacterium]